VGDPGALRVHLIQVILLSNRIYRIDSAAMWLIHSRGRRKPLVMNETPHLPANTHAFPS
jgi:hypothetical protein